MFRRCIFTTYSLLLTVYLSMACPLAPASAVAGEAQEIKIVASFYPMYIMAKNVIKDVPGVSAQNLTLPLTGCLHDYTVTTNDMKKLADAQVFVANGAGLESFLDRIAAGYPNIKIIQLADGMPLIKGEGNEGDNPHVWVSIFNAIIQVKNLGKAMEEFDPSHKELYAKNTANYVARLEALRQKMHSELALYKGRLMITLHHAVGRLYTEKVFHSAVVAAFNWFL